MILSIRGTNGAGKSTLVRHAMSLYSHRHPLYAGHYVDELGPRMLGRRKPVGYHLWKATPEQCLPTCDFSRAGKIEYDVRPDLFVPGHYEIANGGIDTIRSVLDAYSLILLNHRLGCDVIYEGKNMSDGWRNVEEFLPKSGTRILLIAEPVEKCIESVRERGHTIKEATIRRLWDKCRRDYERLRALNYECSYGGRESILECVEQILGFGCFRRW